MKKIVNFIIVAGFFANCISVQTFAQPKKIASGYDPVRIQRLADLQQEMIDKWFLGSSHVVIYKDDEMIFNSIVNSDKEGDQDITEQTIFPIWSMSKPITTVAVMILFEEGKFMLDDPIGWYIPELGSLQCLDKEGNEYPCKNSITIRNLLTHESGFGYYHRSLGNNSFSYYEEQYTDLEDLTKKIANIPLAFEPGTKYKYGISTAILGRLVEVVSGQEFYVFLKERIFDPLDMPNTDFDLTPDERELFQPLFIREEPTGYFTREYDELSYQPGIKIQLGGEGMVSTTEDYSHFCEMLLNDGVYKEKRILSPTSIAWMHEPITECLLKGFKSGFTVFHLSDPLMDGALSPEGIFGWGGHNGTFFWIDQQNNLYGLVMTRRLGGSISRLIWKKIRLFTYQALN